MWRLGFIGTGVLAEAVIHSLQTVRGDELVLYLSPRSHSRSASLAADYSNVTRMESNQEVLEHSDVVFLGMRPQQLNDALVGLQFRAEQIVVSFLANTPCSTVLSKVAPVTRVRRVIPTSAIKYRQGPVLQYPRDEVIEDIFRHLGDRVVVSQESELTALSQASALMSAHFQLQNTLVDWLQSRGVAARTATNYVHSMFQGFAQIARSDSRDCEPLIPASYETLGGLNECGRRCLAGSGWFEQVIGVLDTIEAHIVLPSTSPTR